MKKIIKAPAGKGLLLWACVLLSFVIFLILWGISQRMIGKQESQQMANRWSDNKNVAQVSCFFSANVSISPDSIEEMEHKLDAKLQEASIVSESLNPGARLWADAYSAYGRIKVDSNHGSITADAIGIGGDFFLFHPLKLLSGSYFSGNDLVQDYCILDEDAAWRLFGSNDIAGQIVYIREIPHVVAGVIEREEGRLQEAAGLDSSVIYVSYDTLNQYGTHSGINHYEIVMPNPVKGFALGYVKELIPVDEQEMEVIENTSRFDLWNRIKRIGSFGTHSMNGKAIIYPYWENLARGCEDILMAVTLLMLFFLAYPVIVILCKFIYWWRYRTWNLKTIWNKIRGGAFHERKKY